MPGRVEADSTPHVALTPREIVAELDRFIVGQSRAKKAVAIALRNRYRRQQLSPEMAEEVIPKNILMIGPTGVGKTEIARRLARLERAPFFKVEASKFTEVGYVGRDVESMVRDMVEIAIDMVRQERREQVKPQARRAAEDRLLDLLLPPPPRPPRRGDAPAAPEGEDTGSWERSRETLRRKLQAGELEERVVETEVSASPNAAFRMFTPAGMEEMNMNLRDVMPGLFQGSKRQRKMTVADAREHLQREEEEKLIDPDQLSKEAIRRVEESGILFIDEIDKISGREGGHGPEVSREGVQRDLLPIVEGTLVNTKHGMVRTDHILFIAAGAFHVSKPSDLIPELQGRFPIRVELDALGTDDLIRILTEPEASLVKQYRALMETEGIELEFTREGIATIAEVAEEVNRRTENIGARRLHTVLEHLLEEISFAGSESPQKRIVIDESYVRTRLADVAADTDLSRYVL
ncbi:MAG: ATP-dependent protease ATPase subunit HslU [Acidobacteriota bacterium]|nr:ATP-dependent protease ATPase subunit HslU [Acidobacteriota bacterium]